jgi:hypothetical protein
MLTYYNKSIATQIKIELLSQLIKMQTLSTETFFGQCIQSYMKDKPLMNQNCAYMVKNEDNILNAKNNDIKMFTLLCKNIKILF